MLNVVSKSNTQITFYKSTKEFNNFISSSRMYANEIHYEILDKKFRLNLLFRNRKYTKDKILSLIKIIRNEESRLSYVENTIEMLSNNDVVSYTAYCDNILVEQYLYYTFV